MLLGHSQKTLLCPHSWNRAASPYLQLCAYPGPQSPGCSTCTCTSDLSSIAVPHVHTSQVPEPWKLASTQTLHCCYSRSIHVPFLAPRRIQLCPCLTPIPPKVPPKPDPLPRGIPWLWHSPLREKRSGGSPAAIVTEDCNSPHYHRRNHGGPLQSLATLTSGDGAECDHTTWPTWEPETSGPNKPVPLHHLLVEAFPHQKQSVNYGRGDCSIKPTDINTSPWGTWKSKEPWHQRNTIIF